MLSRLRQRNERADIAGNLKRDLPEQEFRGTVHAVEHHLCHLASAFLVSPYDEAVAVSVDGFGDFSHNRRNSDSRFNFSANCFRIFER